MKSKSCRVCEETKPIEEFVKRPDRENAYRNVCKDCHRQYVRDYYHNNKESRSAYNKSWRENNQDKVKSKSKTYYQDNKDSILSYARDWRYGNKDKMTSYGATRRSSKLQACPSWLSDFQKAEIESIYNLAKDCSIVSGQIYHVDHIVPLRGKSVCGLHVPWNLQVLPSDINLSKNNSYNGW